MVDSALAILLCISASNLARNLLASLRGWGFGAVRWGGWFFWGGGRCFLGMFIVGGLQWMVWVRADLSWVMFWGWGGDGSRLSCLVDFLWMFLGGFFVDVFCVTFLVVLVLGFLGRWWSKIRLLKPKIEQRKLEKRSRKCESKALGSLTVVRHDDTKMHEGTVGRIGWLAQILIRICGVYTYYGI